MKILKNKEYENIANHLVKGGKAITENEKLLKTILKCKKLLNYGGIVRKGKTGTKNTLKQVSTNLKKLFALNVEKKKLDTIKTQSSVRKNVEVKTTQENLEEKTQITTKTEARVYDLMVENSHEFFA